MKKLETKFPSPAALCTSSSRRAMEETNRDYGDVLAILEEWERIQKHLLYCVLAPSTGECSWRTRIEVVVRQSTGGHAQIWWEPLSYECMLESGQLIEIRYQQIRYGMLKLVPGYLTSHNLPDIPQSFAHLCAVLLTLVEHQTLVQSLLKTLRPLDLCESLTAREQDILRGMACGECETAIAERLSIALTTVRTHRHHIYQCLDVCNPKDAVLRGFALRLLNWIDLASSAAPQKHIRDRLSVVNSPKT